MSSSVKNRLFIIISLMIIMVICVFASFATTSKEDEDDTVKDEETLLLERATDESNSVLKEHMKEFDKISVDEYIDIYNGSEKKMVLIGRSGCQYCKIAEPIIKKIMYDNDLTIYYISTDDFTQESYNKFKESNEKLQGFSTPLLLVVSNGEIIDSVEGLQDTALYTKFMKTNEFIK